VGQPNRILGGFRFKSQLELRVVGGSNEGSIISSSSPLDHTYDFIETAFQFET